MWVYSSVNAVDCFAYGHGCLFVDAGLASNAPNATYSICRVNPVNVSDTARMLICCLQHGHIDSTPLQLSAVKSKFIWKLVTQTAESG